MPIMDGISSTLAIRREELINGSYTPIVGITAYALMGDKEKCLNSGMDDYISKPIEVDLLNEVIKKYLK